MLTEKEKSKLKVERLKQYACQIYVLEMDVTALLSTSRIEDSQEADRKSVEIKQLMVAYAAVEAML